MRKIFLSAILAILCLMTLNATASLNPSFSKDIYVDTVPFFPNGTYDPAIPHPNEFLQYPIGKFPLRYHELVNYIKVLADKSDRVKYEVTGQTFEGRDLYAVYIGTKENIDNLELIKEKANLLATPNSVSTDAALDDLINTMPAVAWLGYSIHGDEISGVDAAAMMIYQLAAGTDDYTMNLLNNILIIIDPSENPDGRERYVSMLQTYKSKVPNYDRFSQQHSGVWPYGRGNHYLFDLNRDWIIVSQPETKARVKTIVDWKPHLVVDAHEMGSNATYLFTPPRQPINYNTPDNVTKWWDVFQSDQSSAFDKNGWSYYIKEWHEQWYPGYGSAWPTFFGTIGILYEQAGVDGEMVRQRDNYILTYHEAINHHFTSCLTNLNSLADHKNEILKDYYNTRKQISESGKVSFIIEDKGDPVKIKRFIESQIAQGIEVVRADESFTVRSAKDIFGNQVQSKSFDAGTYIIKTNQPHGALAKAALEFDPHLKLEFLEEERRELEKYGDTRMYETSTWSLPVAYNLPAFETESQVTVKSSKVNSVVLKDGQFINPDAEYAYVMPMTSENAYKMLVKLFDEKVVIYASEKEFSIDGKKTFAPGTLIFKKRGNNPDLYNILSKYSKEYKVDIFGINTGASAKGSYLGAGTFRLLKAPKVALLTGEPLSSGSFGSVWHYIDERLEIPHSLVDIGSLAWSNIDQYNVTIMPGSWGNRIGSVLGRGGERSIKDWVSNGGTLITVGAASVWAADSSTGFSGVVLKRQVLKDLDKYDKSLDKMIAAEAPKVDTMALWHPEKVLPKKDDVKKEDKGGAPKDIDELDEWQRKFSPQGVYLKVELDTEDWLNFGLGKAVPASIYTRTAFLADDRVRVSGRFAVDENQLRVSGLLWPEARSRWAKTVYSTHERNGKGQLILFANDPIFRAYNFGTGQMLLNAILYGPGMGSSFEGPYNEESRR